MALFGSVVSSDAQGDFGFRNKIINGSMRFWQRGTSFSGSTQYTADRFVVNSSTGTVTRDTDVPTGQGFTYSMKQVSSTQAFCFLQPVELVGTGLAGEFYVGSTWTFSFWMKGSGSGSIALGPEFRDTGISATNFVAAASSTTINYTSTWTKFSYTFTITGTPAGTNTGLSCILFQGSQTGSLWATGFQLEKGSVVTPFEFRPLTVELQLCQRYFYKTYNTDVAVGTSTSVGSVYCETLADGTLSRLKAFNPRLPVSMRATPTVTLYSQTGTADRINVYSNSGSTITISSVQNHGTNSLLSYIQTSTNAVAAQTYEFHATASAEL